MVALNYSGVVHGSASYSLLSLPPEVTLRDGAGLGQALIYVRPIQQNLDMSELVNQENTLVVSG